MALICPTCRTENRDAAKFCKGCGGKLVSLPVRSSEESEALDDAWGDTVVASPEDDHLPPSLPPSRASRPSALHTASVEPSPARGTSRTQRRRSAPPPRDRSAFWLLLAAATIVVATGGLYVYRDQHRTPLLTVVQEQAPGSPVVPASTPRSAALPITGSVTPAQATAPVAPAAPAASVQEASTPPAAASSAAAARKPRKAASAAVPPAAPPPVAAAPVAPVAPAPEPVDPPPPADPSQACAGRGFIATSQCLVTQCAKPEFSAHARCDAVRKQQQIDEEKRNPSNAA